MSHFSWWADGSIVGLYLLATMIAGVMVRKYVARVDDFLVAGREMNVYLGIASLAATEFGVVTCMYTAQNGYEKGFAGAVPGLCQAVAMFIIGVTGFCIKPLREAGVMVQSMEQIDRIGMVAALEKAIDRISRDVDGIYLSFDMDSLDPRHAPGVGTPVPGGLTYREAHLACEVVAETGKLIGMDLVEVNPILDVQNQTAILAVEFIRSALGSRVWSG